MKSTVALFPLLLVLVAPPASAADPAPVPLFDGLGSYSRSVSTASRGGAALFRPGSRVHVRLQPRRGDPLLPRAAALDPDCAMASGVSRSPTDRTSTTPPCRKSTRRSVAALARPSGPVPARAPSSANSSTRRRTRYVRPAARRPQRRSTAPMPTRCATVWKSHPERCRRGRPVRRSARRPASLGPVDRPTGSRRPGAEADRRARRSARARTRPPAGQPPLHPRARGLALSGTGDTRRGRTA